MTINSISSFHLTDLNGVGDHTVKQLNKLGIFNIVDLLFYLPYKYTNKSHITTIQNLELGNKQVIEITIEHKETQNFRRKISTITGYDETGVITLKFFNTYGSFLKQFEVGKKYKFYGDIKHSSKGIELIHPEIIKEKDFIGIYKEKLFPAYHLTEGLNQKKLYQLIIQALDLLRLKTICFEDNFQKYIPSDFYTIEQALNILHCPSISEPIVKLENVQHNAHLRLIIEELSAFYLSILKLKNKNLTHQSYQLNNPLRDLESSFLKNLPFSLTRAQEKVVLEIKNDFKNNFPMKRLVQGDVGSGKTLVSALAALDIIQSGHQVALMAPTELLAEQHFHNFKEWFSPLNIQVGLLLGKHTPKKKKSILNELFNKKIQLVIGTHALFQGSVNYSSLALIIIDEQHRFGVAQRDALLKKGISGNIVPHQLVMTATPIPRTLALSAFKELDVSVIDELPPGRTPIETVVFSNNKRLDLIKKIRKMIQVESVQVYWVCTLIDDSETLEAESVEALFRSISSIMQDIRIDFIHSQMSSEKKIEVMNKFNQNEIKVLVSTTVIEVGVNVPNASIMVIENSERLGLSQIHQLRGRVGRGTKKSYCLLMYQEPISEISKKRLEVIRSSTDGFFIAEEDLKLRGPGEILGYKQTGDINMKIACLLRDANLLVKAQEIAKNIYQEDKKSAHIIMEKWSKYQSSNIKN